MMKGMKMGLFGISLGLVGVSFGTNNIIAIGLAVLGALMALIGCFIGDK